MATPLGELEPGEKFLFLSTWTEGWVVSKDGPDVEVILDGPQIPLEATFSSRRYVVRLDSPVLPVAPRVH